MRSIDIIRGIDLTFRSTTGKLIFVSSMLLDCQLYNLYSYYMYKYKNLRSLSKHIYQTILDCSKGLMNKVISEFSGDKRRCKLIREELSYWFTADRRSIEERSYKGA